MQDLKGYVIGLGFIAALIAGLNGYYLIFRLSYEPYPVWLAWGMIKIALCFYLLVALGVLLRWLREQLLYACCFARLFFNELKDSPHNAPR